MCIRDRGIERLFSLGSLAALASARFGAGASHYEDVGELTRALDAELSADIRLLIKGSRVNRLERVVEAIAIPPHVRKAG